MHANDFLSVDNSLTQRIYRRVTGYVHVNDKDCCEATKVVLDSRIGEAAH